MVPQVARAATFIPVDLDQLDLGATIVGPVGPEVEMTFVNDAGEGLGDLISSVSCPTGFDSCVPPDNPLGTLLYTYKHEVTPGVDFPNDPPFPTPASVLPIDNVSEFRLDFAAAGFTGIVGFSFSEAVAAIGSEDISIEQLGDSSLIWQLPLASGWGTGETITFFWQTTQPPTGPGGVYGLANAEQIGTGAGPLPAPVVPEGPNSLALLIVSGVFLVGRRRLAKHKQCDR
ncbi:MAG: exosortase, PEP-CTERM interaction domain protein [Cyanobacteria bacterium J06642_2]